MALKAQLQQAANAVCFPHVVLYRDPSCTISCHFANRAAHSPSISCPLSYPRVRCPPVLVLSPARLEASGVLQDEQDPEDGVWAAEPTGKGLGVGLCFKQRHQAM